MTRSAIAPSLQCGQNVYMVCGLQVESVTFLRHVNGRCLVSWENGGTSVNQSRLFLTEDEAKQHLPTQLSQAGPDTADYRGNSDHHRDHTDFIWGMEEPYEPEGEFGYTPVSNHRDQAWRYNPTDAPGDGWARTSRNGRW